MASTAQIFRLAGVAGCALILLAGCSHSLEGQLVDGAGLGISHRDSRINLTGLDGGAFQRMVAVDDDGYFAIEDEVPPGEYLLEALVPGYGVASLRFRYSEAMTLQLKLQAKPLPSEPLAPIAGSSFSQGSGAATLAPPRM